MDVSERLSSDELARHDYLAASHLHRYAVAAELCSGLRVVDLACGTGYGSALLAEAGATVTGVDVDPRAVEAARREHDGPAFECEDALTFLRRAQDIDAVVMFEGLEHVPDPEAVLAELERLAGSGVRLVVSVPNSRVFGEVNPFHLTDFGPDEARRAFARFGERTEWLYQYLAEGSLILPADGGEDFAGRVEALHQAEPEYAATIIAAVGFADGALRRASARLHLVATPNHYRYMLELERALRVVHRANRELGRGIYGHHDAAAASVAARLDERIRELENRAWILGEEKKQLEQRLDLESGWSYAPHHRALHRAVQGAKRVPGLAPAAQALRRRRARRSLPPSR